MNHDVSGPVQIEEYIGKQLKNLRRNYRSTGDSGTALIAADAIVLRFEGMPAARASQQLAKLYSFVCDLRLAHVSSFEDLEAVRESAEKSLSLLYASPEKSPRAIQSIASASLYLAVALKAGGKIDESFRSIDQAKKDLKRFFDTNLLDEVSLSRQEVLMRQESSGFSKLLEGIPGYLDHSPDEAYASTKRVFEYALNHGLMFLAEELFPLLRETYRLSADKLSPVARISFQKNVGHFYIISGKPEAAVRVLKAALSQAVSLGFKGQELQISGLLNEMMHGRGPVLDPFRLK